MKTVIAHKLSLQRQSDNGWMSEFLGKRGHICVLIMMKEVFQRHSKRIINLQLQAKRARLWFVANVGNDVIEWGTGQVWFTQRDFVQVGK